MANTFFLWRSYYTNKIGHIISKIGNSFYTYVLVGFLFIFWSVNSFNNRMIGIGQVSNFLDGREVQANWVIGENGAEQYRKILKSKMGLWAQDNHVWGIYYGIDNVHRGEFNNPDLQYVIDRMIDENIGWIYSKGSDNIKKIQDSCSDSLTKIKTNSLYEFNLYKVSIKKITSCNELKKIK